MSKEISDENVSSTPLYDAPPPDNKGPYYVPWKETSMEAYNEYTLRKRYKRDRKYIPGSTLGNIPTDDKKSDK